MKEKVTIRDIARECGVSKSTVSLILLDKYGPKEETRAAVMLVAKQLGYDFGRQTKRHPKTKKICVLAYKGVLSENFWSEIFFGIEQSLLEHNLKSEILLYDENNIEDFVLLKLKKIDYIGIISVDFSNDRLEEFILSNKIKTVLIDPRGEFRNEFSLVSPSNYASSYDCAKYFYDKGHRRLAFFGSSNYGRGFNQRFLGFSDFCKTKDIHFYPIINRGNDIIEGICDGEQFLDIFSKKKYPTAVMCANDIIAFYAYELLKKCNLQVGVDVSLVGFDNRQKCTYISPKLSSFESHKKQIGKKAVEIILEQNPEKQIIEVCSTLIERESVADLSKY